MEFKEIQNKTENELRRILAEQRGLMYDLRLKLSVNQTKNVRQIRDVRKTIGKILTQLDNIRKDVSISKKA